VKVYKIKEQGETTYIAFDGDKNESLEWYIRETSCDENDIDSIKKFPQEKWKEVTIVYDEENLTQTIEEYMQGHAYNEVICSSAYL